MSIMPNPIISVFSDIPQSSETSAGSSAAQNTQRYEEIEQIAKYNRENNTNFYTLAQIQEHQKKLQELERAKAVASNPDQEDVRDAYISALNPQTTEDVDKIRKWDKDAATTTAIGTTVGTLPFWGPAAAHVLGVLANPATASTTFGSLAATGADIAGIYAGGKGLFSDANKIASGNYSWKDVPITGLNLIGFTPGASVLTRAGNWRTAINTGTNVYNTAKGWAPIFTNKQYWQALPGNTKSLITTLTPSGKRILQSIADDTYTAMANRVESIAKNSKFPNTKDVGIEAGFPEKSLITARGDFGNPTIRADVTNPDLMEFFGAKPLNTKVNYTFSLDPNSVQMAGFRGTDGIQINRAHFLFPFKSSSGEWKMLNVNGMNGNPYTLVGHEAGHAAMAQINPLKGIKPFKLNGANFTINKENELFHSGKDFSSLLSKAGTHDGLPEEYLADYFGELASRGLPQNTDWNLIPEATRMSIINSISNRRSMPQSQVQQLLDGLSDYGYIGSKPIEIPQLTGHFGQVKYYGPTMGKTTAAKSNPKLVDFDDVIRQPSRSILDRFGFKNKAEMYNSGNQEAIKAYEDMLVKSLRDWRANPENSNLTLVASPTAIANPTKTGFYFDNMPSIPSRSVFIARNVGRGGTPEASAMWYDSLMEKNPNLKIDNRFVSEIEKQAYITPNTGYKSIFMEEPIMGRGPGRPKKSSTEALISPEAWDEMLFEDMIGEQGAINTARKASQAGKRVLKPITEAEKLGIPKGLRSDARALEDMSNTSGIRLAGFNFNDLPTARFKFDSNTGNFKVRVPRKKWVTQAEQLVEDYFFTPEEYNRLIASGATPEQAELISTVRTANVENRLPSKFSSLGRNIFGDTSNIEGRSLVRYNRRTNVPAALIDPQRTFNTVFHELGGHGATLNIGSGTQTIPEGQHEILKSIFKHNMELHPELRPEWKAIKDGNIELAKKLMPDVDDMYKSTKGEWNIKALQDAINYMEDVQEYSARAVGANMSNHYGIGKGWNETQLRKFFTDESVDNLMKNVWGIIPIAGIGLGTNTLKEKQGGKIKTIF